MPDDGGDSRSSDSGADSPPALDTVSVLDWVIVVGYVLLSIGVGLFAGRESQTGETSRGRCSVVFWRARVNAFHRYSPWRYLG
jgi:hypothetical protein